jgi:starch-binding outer membrane protein, SusD/RagB family
MRHINKTAFFILFAGLLFASCKKAFLDLKPYDQVSFDDAIVNEGDMQAAVNGVYANLRDADLFGRSIPLNGDLLADNVYLSVVNSNRYIPEFSYSYIVTNGNVGNTWADAYTTILRANNVINSGITKTAVTDQLKGEALTLRALMYFELVKFFAKPYVTDQNAPGVPLVLKYDPVLKPSRNTVKEVFTQIEKDLNEAYGLLTVTKNSSYITKYVPKALLARMYQYMGDWAKAEAAALDVINNGGYTLSASANFVAYWNNPGTVTNKLETVFEVSVTQIEQAGTNSLAYFYDQAGYGDALCTDDLFAKYAATDARRALIIDAVRGGIPVKVVNKYPNTNNTNEKDNVKVIRYAEVLLILAEAYNKQGKDTEALTVLNQLAQRRDPSFTGYTSSGAALFEDILLERRKELAFEGHRYWDFMRTGRDVVRNNSSGNYPANVPVTFPASNFRRIFPVPQAELDANKNIAQNQGY